MEAPIFEPTPHDLKYLSLVSFVDKVRTSEDELWKYPFFVVIKVNASRKFNFFYFLKIRLPSEVAKGFSINKEIIPKQTSFHQSTTTVRSMDNGLYKLSTVRTNERGNQMTQIIEEMVPITVNNIREYVGRDAMKNVKTFNYFEDVPICGMEKYFESNDLGIHNGWNLNKLPNLLTTTIVCLLI